MSYGNSFYQFCALQGIGRVDYLYETKQNEYIISWEEFETLKRRKLIFDGRNGGLVLGKLHSEGGIHCLKQHKEKFIYCGEMEGWEYLSAPLRDEKIKKEFERINSVCKEYDKSIQINFKIPNHCKTINMTGCSMPIVLLSNHGQYIVNRLSTKVFIEDIIKLDKILDLL